MHTGIRFLSAAQRVNCKYLLMSVIIFGILDVHAKRIGVNDITAAPVRVDICIYGGTSAGVIAAYTAKKLGKSVLLIEPGVQVGGLTTGGLGYTDIGNKYAISGLSRDFYRRVGAHYGKLEQWIFEPHVALGIFQDYIKSAGIPVRYHHRLVSVKKDAQAFIREIVIESSDQPGMSGYQLVAAQMFIDCSYEGDLMAKAGVTYFTGREDNNLYHETYNGVQLRDKHQFPDGISPYKIPGDTASGLLWGVSAAPLEPQGSGDKKIQTYNFRLCLTNEPANRINITRPKGYDSTRYELLLRVLEKKPAKDLNALMKFDYMPNHKTDINNNGPFSTDMIGMNYNYPEADYTTRARIQEEHANYVKGLLYFIGHDTRVPQYLREEMLPWGYPKDEYRSNNNWTPQMYVREVRRMKGVYIMTQANCEAKETVTDQVGMAAYTMDSHNCQRIIINGMVKNEGDVQIGGFGPYPVAYRAIIPVREECKNLLVPVCLSATHIAYGSIRMEPVFMVLAQSAATAAVMAIDAKKPVQDVDINQLKQILKMHPLADNSTVEILVDNDDSLHTQVTGKWNTLTKGSYGPSMYTADKAADSSVKRIRFMPGIIQDGMYNVYAYLPKLGGMASRIQTDIFDGTTHHSFILEESAIKIEGQTSGEWVALGKYALAKGSGVFVEMNTQGANGIVPADAILFVPVKKQ